MSFESLEESAFKKLYAEIKSLRKEFSEFRESMSLQAGNVTASNTLYNNRKMCQILGVSKGTLEKYRNDGEITFTKKGRKYFYNQADLDLFLQRKRSTNTNQSADAGKAAS